MASPQYRLQQSFAVHNDANSIRQRIQIRVWRIARYYHPLGGVIIVSVAACLYVCLSVCLSVGVYVTR